MAEKRLHLRLRGGDKSDAEATVVLKSRERATRWVVNFSFEGKVKDASLWPGLASKARTEMLWVGPSEAEAFASAEKWFREHYEVGEA